MKILIVTEYGIIHRFVEPTLRELLKEKPFHFDCLLIDQKRDITELSATGTFQHIYQNEYPSGIWKKMPGPFRFMKFIFNLKRIGRSLGPYDIVHVCFHHFYYSLFLGDIMKHSRKLYISFFGSDFNRVEWYRHIGNYLSARRADTIFGSNRAFLDTVINRYRLRAGSFKSRLLIFYVPPFEAFLKALTTNGKEDAKRNMGISKKIMVCGYNAATHSNHEGMIRALLENRDRLSAYTILFPMTYGENAAANRGKVTRLMHDSGLDVRVIDKNMTNEQVRDLRLGADIMIQAADRDQLSGSVLEHLAAGSVVIAGSWLPYDQLSDMGAYFVSFDQIAELPATLASVIDNLGVHQSRTGVNLSIVKKILAWENWKQQWLDIYSSEKP